jgi:hypothetical protein
VIGSEAPSTPCLRLGTLQAQVKLALTGYQALVRGSLEHLELAVARCLAAIRPRLRRGLIDALRVNDGRVSFHAATSAGKT